MKFAKIGLGYNSSNGISLEFYISGCKQYCKNCHNQELWNFDFGKECDNKYIGRQISKFKNKYDNFVILGGEPLDQNIPELVKFLKYLAKKNTPIWLYTSYELADVEPEVFLLCHYIKTGKYIEEQKTENNIQYGVKLATTNQNIFKIKGEII